MPYRSKKTTVVYFLSTPGCVQKASKKTAAGNDFVNVTMMVAQKGMDGCGVFTNSKDNDHNSS